MREYPPICGLEGKVTEIVSNRKFPGDWHKESNIDFGSIKSAFTIALHMHQPLIPAGGSDLQTAAVINNLQFMFENPDIGDNHNAGVFLDCYQRMGDFIPQLVGEGKEPRVMFDYSGTLFWGLERMGAHEALDKLKRITCEPQYRRCVEWLGMPWGHAVAPSTPIQDYRDHLTAWQQHFMELFGEEALARVRGFSPSEMALPNHPDVAYEFVLALKDAGYEWIMVQEHTVEQPENGHSPERPHLPHMLRCQNSKGETIEIIALVKTQGSDTKLVAQMQPYYEACGVDRTDLGGKSIPPLVTQIADGENGGVMMNEFPSKYLEGVHSASYSHTPIMNGSEYLDHLFAIGITEKDLPVIQPVHQKLVWENFEPGAGPDKLEKAIAKIKESEHQFHMEGGSWTNNISWVQGYENVLGPMEKVSSKYHQVIRENKIPTDNPKYCEALFYLLVSQTSCYRYWGQGTFTDYGIELCRRAEGILDSM